MKSSMEKKKRKRYFLIVAGILVLVAILTVVGQVEIANYEKSVVSLYAMQQDDYVQLVLDQINLQKNRADEEIISDILGTLDSSSRKYWTLTKDQALLFVKNVMETNRYKGFTTGSYFASDSAQVFLQRLNENHVIHENIEMDGENYVASGVIFNYQGSKYKICLLTNESVIIDQNVFFETKISIHIYIIGLLLLIALSVMYLTRKLHQAYIQNENMVVRMNEQNKIITDLGQQIRMIDAYHSRYNVFNLELMPTFEEKLAEKGITKTVKLALTFENKEKRDEFLGCAQLLLDEKVFRFGKEDENLVLMFVDCDVLGAKIAVRRVGDFGQEVEEYEQ